MNHEAYHNLAKDICANDRNDSITGLVKDIVFGMVYKGADKVCDRVCIELPNIRKYYIIDFEVTFKTFTRAILITEVEEINLEMFVEFRYDNDICAQEAFVRMQKIIGL